MPVYMSLVFMWICVCVFKEETVFTYSLPEITFNCTSWTHSSLFPYKMYFQSQARWLTPIIPVFRKWRQESCGERPAWTTETVSKTKLDKKF